MRLSTIEVNEIKEAAKKNFGEETSVILFGSRVDDSKRGGDIDLFIEPQETIDLFMKKINFLVALENKIGEQKIDVVLAPTASESLKREVSTKGVAL